MEKFAEKVNGMAFELNEKGEMKQNVRNAFKHEVMAEVFAMFQEAGLDVGMVADGVAVNFQNAGLGNVAVVFNGVVKGNDFDFDYEVEAFEKAVAEKAEKAEAQAKAKAEKIAMQKVEKEAKANAKNKAKA